MKKIFYFFLTPTFSMLYADLTAPSNLTLTPTSTTIMLNWKDNSNNESGFKIFRNKKLITITKPNSTTFIDIGLKPQTLYNYTLKATDDKDSNYLYQDGEEVIIEVASDGKLVDIGEGVGIWQSDGNGGSKPLINAYTYNSFFTEVDDKLDTNYKIVKKDGGFDIVYTFTNYTDKDINLPILKLPKIGFGDINTLNILNPLFKHYLEKRDLSKEKHSYFNVANIFRTINGTTYEEHYPYGTQFVYSPVIVATNGDFAIGAALKLDYNQKKYRLKPYMKITKDENEYWSYEFDLQKNIIKSNDVIKLTLSIRVSRADKWIFTLSPYKDFLNNVLVDKRVVYDKKDLRPIQSIEMGGFSNGIGDRFWSEDILKNGESTIDLAWFLETKGKRLKEQGFKRATFWNFSGLYKNLEDKPYTLYGNAVNTRYGDMQEQLPFQFISKQKGILPEHMRADLIRLENDNNNEFTGIDVGYDWGISGNIPINENGEVLKFNQWMPKDIVRFDINNNSHKLYAQHYIDEAKNLKGIFKPTFLRLDAFSRMDRDGSDLYGYSLTRIEWLKHLIKSLPYTTFATESSIDYMHALTANILQPDSIYGWKGLGTREEQDLKEPDLLAIYLNPSSETYVWINANAQLDNNTKFRENISDYIKSLISNGYTPLVEYWDVVDVKEIDTSVPECMDRLDNNNDGNIDWPYDEGCNSPADRKE